MTDTVFSQTDDDRRARRNVMVLVTAQALLGAQLPINFTVAGLIGLTLAPSAVWATVPISVVVFGSMTTASWISPLMQRHGRRFGFMLGAAAGAAGAALAMLALVLGNFWIFLLGAYFTGIFMSTLGFYRFAATDTASDTFRPKAISYVMAGGLISAFVARFVVTGTETATIIPFLATYGVVFAMNAVGIWLFLLLDIPKPPAPKLGDAKGRSRAELLADPTIR